MAKIIKKAAAPKAAKKSPAKPAPKAASAAPAARAAKPVSAEERYRMIQEAAYYIAEGKKFASDPFEDWRQAETQIDTLLRKEGRL